MLGRDRTSGDDRRDTQRYPVEQGAVRLGWYEGGQHRYASAVILDLSHGGARILADAEPPAAGSAWLRPHEDPVAEWCEIIVLQARRLRSGHFLVRLKFYAHCPYDIFKQAVVGNDLRGHPMSASPEFEGRVWK